MTVGWRKLFFGLILSLMVIYPCMAGAEQTVYVIPVRGTIDPSMASFVDRSIGEAEGKGADLILFEIDTFGGRIDSAIEIKDRIMSASVPSAAFVTKKAISAGALVTLAADKIVMAPGTTIGAAEPRLGEEKADEKVVSMWSKELASTAEAHGRNGQIAAAMADADIVIPGLVEKGKLLTLTQEQALNKGFADFSAANRGDALKDLGFPGAREIIAKPSAAETLGTWATSPYVAPILLLLGISGIVVEIFTIGWGVAGTIGLISFALFFGGHILAGFTGWESVFLFILGLILLALEAFVIPGFGVTGVAGIIAVGASIIIASASVEQALVSLVVALIGSLLLLILSFRFMKTRRIWNRLVLGVRQENTAGYVAPAENLDRFAGRDGITLSPLRPAGVAEINGERVDVVTEGGFIPAKSRISVVKVEGTRVVVKQIES